MLTSTRSMVSTSAVLMLILSPASAAPASSRDRSSEARSVLMEVMSGVPWVSGGFHSPAAVPPVETVSPFPLASPIGAGRAVMQGFPATRGQEIPTRRGVECGVSQTARPRSMDASKIESFVAGKWDDEIGPQLVEYIRIPNKSPVFDADGVEPGYMDDAGKWMEGWARPHAIPVL